MQSLRKAMDQVHHVLKTENIANIALRMLACINREAVLHSVRTAYLAWKTAEVHPLPQECSLQNLVFLSLFHTIGFFREDIHFNYFPHEANLDYFSDEKFIESRYVFTSYYLEYMTPLKGDAVILQSFLQPYNKERCTNQPKEAYNNIIYLCARISDYWGKNKGASLPEDLNELAPGYFNPEYVEAFKIANKDNVLINAIQANIHQDALSNYIAGITCPTDEKKYLEKMLVHLLDFKSTSTMKHAINASCIALSLGLRMQFDDEAMTTLFTSAFLHDIGKIATPQRILEFPGKLTPEDMGIMRHHVNHSKRILSGHVNEEILQTVYRHHEKLNGKGYPRQVEGKDLTLIQRTLTVADITSALNDSRSYKGEFSKEQTIAIITDMTNNGEIDPQITKFIIEDYDTILQEQQIFQTMLQIDFSKVIASYNNYILNNAVMVEEISSDDNSDGLEELDDLEEL